MNYLEKFQTLSKEDAKQSIFDSLNSKAMDALNTIKSEQLVKSSEQDNTKE